MALWGSTADNKSENNINKYTSYNNDNTKMKDVVTRLTNELISLWGVNIFYIMHDGINDDNVEHVLLEKDFNTFSNIHHIRMLLEDFDQEDAFGYFQLKLSTGDVEFMIGKELIENIIGRKPMVNDIIYHEPSKFLFKIVHPEDHYEPNVYAGGHRYVYKLRCKAYTRTEKDIFNIRAVSMRDLNNFNEGTTLTEAPVINNGVTIDSIDNTENDPFI